MKKLSLLNSIPLGIGSIIGSGILFLPSLTYKVSGSDVLISWLLIILLCIPGIIFFKEMISKLSVENSSLSGMVELGLGKEVGKSVHLILLGTVVLGMPSAAIIAGDYCQEVIKISYVKEIVAISLIAISIGVNFFGIKASSLVSFLLSALLIVISLYIIWATKQPMASYEVIHPRYDINNIYSGAVLAFWAFAGFENLTFLYSKFENPQRDLIITIGVSVVICGLIYLGLVSNYAAIVPFSQIKDTTGLLQMVSISSNKAIVPILGTFAVLAVLVNLISWTSGIVELIKQVSKTNLIPGVINIDDRKALFILGGLFLTSTTIGLISPYIFSKLLVLVSTNFLVLYLLSLISFCIITTSKWKRILSFVIVISILVTLSSSSYLLIYPFALYLYTYFKLNK